MIAIHAYQDYQITVQCKEHRVSARQSAWSAAFQYTREGVMVQEFVQACARQKTCQAARDKALRFAIIAIDARAELSSRSAGSLRATRRSGALERLAAELGRTPPVSPA